MSFEDQRHDVGEGWQPLIQKLHEDLTALDPAYTVEQIKEKFGGLRYYIGFSEDRDEETTRQMDALIWAAEEQSVKTCETCGEPGSVRNYRYWLTAACDEHARK